MKTIYLSLALIMIFGMKTKELPKIESKVYHWNQLKVQETSSGERRQLLDGQTLVFDQFEIHATTLNPGQAPHGSHTHLDTEELIIVKEGKIRQTIGADEQILGPGSIVVAMPGDEHGISNAGETKATYYIIKWKTKGFTSPGAEDKVPSLMASWDSFTFEKTDKGGRRKVIRQKTDMVDELEMHVTTLNEGMKSHDQHTHIDEEIILILKGEVEELIDDVPYSAEAGSVIFLNSMIPHGIRNIGKGPCEYFAIRWIPKSEVN